MRGYRLNALLLYPVAERVGGRRIRAHLRKLRRHQRKPVEERRRIHRIRLVRSLEHAGAHVPYYRDLFRRLGFDAARVGIDPRFLEDLPLLTKEIIREQGMRLRDERLEGQRLDVRTTGGSTGPTLPIYYDADALDRTAAVSLFVREWHGARRFGREAHLSTPNPNPVSRRDRVREQIKCAALNRTNVHSTSFDPDGLDQVWRRLRRLRADLVQGHPSTLYALALHVRANGGSRRPLMRLFESTGEQLDDRKRATIEEVLGCTVVNRYGSAEFGVVAYERPGAPGHALEILDSVVWPEVCKDGSGSHELVLTGLANAAMPLLRYRSGDLAEIECRADEVAGRIVVLGGRVHDVVPIAGRHFPTHYIQDVLDRFGPVQEFQVELRDAAPPLLRLVVDEAARDAVRRAVREHWGDALELEFSGHDGLVRQGERSKFRYVVDRRP